jgi:hypothetical protein
MLLFPGLKARWKRSNLFQQRLILHKFDIPTFLATVSGCAAVIALFTGLKKIREELDRRA